MRKVIFFLLAVISIFELQIQISSCAQIIAPTGGPRDSLPPKLISANPKLEATNVTVNRINLNFDEYIQLQELQQNLLVSPTPKNNPYIDYKLKTVIIKLRDTLEPNTTYTINLGNSIRDINEGNQLKDFRYVFSTGATIDSLQFSGKVLVAETGKVDSTLIILLYRNLSDSAVIKQKPKYISRLNAEGNFTFENLSEGTYKVYALKDGDGSRTYNSKAEMFAFADSTIIINSKTKPVTLYAYVEEKELPRVTGTVEKVLRYTTKVSAQKQDVLSNLVIDFNKPLKNVNQQKILLTDTLNNIIKDVAVTIDSTHKTVIVNAKWQQITDYRLIIAKDFATDTTGLALTKSDTIRFKTKGEADYGNLRFKFLNFDKKKNTVLQFVVNDEVVNSFPLTSDIWTAPLFNPGEYELRILFDENKNGKWDAGNFALKQQPEKVYTIPQKLAVKENFEKNIDIELPK
jgi:uncharacterized protein (DUF2141 family)